MKSWIYLPVYFGAATIVILLGIIVLLVVTLGFQTRSEVATAQADQASGPIKRDLPDVEINEALSYTTEELAEVSAPTDMDPAFLADLNSAQAILFEYINLPVNQVSPPCWQLSDKGFQCSQDKFTTWEELRLLNRPAVLELITNGKFKAYAILIGLQNSQALLLANDKTQIQMQLEELGPQWTGEVFYTWKKPKEYEKPIGLGSNHPAVAEIAEQFALLDTQPNPLTRKKFNNALQERIKIFQREQNLIADGIIGERTIMKLNEALGVSTTLQQEFL